MIGIMGGETGVGWPELVGSEKQVVWAARLRAEKMLAFEHAVADEPGERRAMLRAIMVREVRAREWIESRKLPWQVMLVTHCTPEELERFGSGGGGDPILSRENAPLH